jgi:hypothetical protein
LTIASTQKNKRPTEARQRLGRPTEEVMKKIRAIDVPESLIEQLADRLQVDSASAADLLAYTANMVADAVTDFDAERYFDRTGRDISLGYFDCHAPRNLPPRR